jgi:hypothetical protein
MVTSSGGRRGAVFGACFRCSRGDPDTGRLSVATGVQHALRIRNAFLVAVAFADSGNTAIVTDSITSGSSIVAWGSLTGPGWCHRSRVMIVSKPVSVSYRRVGDAAGQHPLPARTVRLRRGPSSNRRRLR